MRLARYPWFSAGGSLPRITRWSTMPYFSYSAAWLAYISALLSPPTRLLGRDKSPCPHADQRQTSPHTHGVLFIAVPITLRELSSSDSKMSPLEKSGDIEAENTDFTLPPYLKVVPKQDPSRRPIIAAGPSTYDLDPNEWHKDLENRPNR